MKIGFDAKRAFHNATGLGNYSRTLIDNLAKYYPESDYLLYNPKKHTSDWGDSYSQITPTGIWKAIPSSLWRSFGLPQNPDFSSLDIYHGLSHELPYEFHKRDCKKVVTIHDLIFLKNVETFPWVDRISYSQKINYALKVSDRIVAISKQTKNDLVHLLDIDDSKIDVIYQSCHPDYFENGTDQKDDYVLYVGAFRQRKNVLNIIRAFSNVKKEFPSYRLVLAGGGAKAYCEQMIYLINTLKLNDSVDIITSPSFEDLKSLYKNASFFVYPSFYEGFGIPMLESLFSKTPVVASSGTCLKEAAGGGALYVDPNSVAEMSIAMARILGDSKLYAELVEKGFQHVQQFRSEQTARSLMSLYKKL